MQNTNGVLHLLFFTSKSFVHEKVLYVFQYHGIKDIIHDRCSISLCSKQKLAFERLLPNVANVATIQ